LRQPKTSRTKFIITYRLTFVKNLTIMVVWQSVSCKVKNNCRVNGIFEDYFRKQYVDLEIIFFIEHWFRLYSHISTLKEEKEYSSEILVTIYQTIWRHVIEESSRENLQSHIQRTFYFSILANQSCQNILPWRLHFAFGSKYFFHKLEFCKCS
jgi:hypothetical protein